MRLRTTVFVLLGLLVATSGFSWCVYCESYTCWMTSVSAGNVYCSSNSGGCIAWGSCDAGTVGCPEGPTGCKRVPTYVPSELKPRTACSAQLADAWTLESVQFTPPAHVVLSAQKLTSQPTQIAKMDR